MTDSQKYRLRGEIRKAGIVVILAFLYYVFVSLTGIMIPCVFRKITGLLCPGCGITHLCVDLAHLRIREAFYDNPACFVVLPVLAVIVGRMKWRYVREGSVRTTRVENVLLGMMVAGLIVYGILRNVFSFSGGF